MVGALFNRFLRGLGQSRAIRSTASIFAAPEARVRLRLREATPARPYFALPHRPVPRPAPPPYVAVSLGVGENPLKRIPDPFEEELLRLVAGTGLALSIDQGAGGEEAERVARALERSGARATVWDGSFAGFAEIIAASRLYIGYDSAGQHVAAACGVPLISVFAGFACARMFDRWRPVGPGCTVVRAERRDPQECLARVKEALARAVGEPISPA